jgi:hypothetical protein
MAGGCAMSWPVIIKLGQVGRSEKTYGFEADEKARKEVVRLLDLASLDRFSGEITVSAWLDGARIEGRYAATLEQICGITAEPLPVELNGEFSLRVLPPGSANAPEPDTEVDIDPDAEDPPDMLEDETLDLTGYAVEHLSLDLEPFPRKPGAEFVPPVETAEISPFAALRALKLKNDGE